MQNGLALDYHGVFDALSKLKALEPIPVGMLGQMYYVLDKMRSAHADASDIAIMEQISVGVRKLEFARRSRNDVAEQSIRESLNSLSSGWIETHPIALDEMAEAAE